MRWDWKRANLSSSSSKKTFSSRENACGRLRASPSLINTSRLPKNISKSHDLKFVLHNKVNTNTLLIFHQLFISIVIVALQIEYPFFPFDRDKVKYYSSTETLVPSGAISFISHLICSYSSNLLIFKGGCAFTAVETVPWIVFIPLKKSYIVNLYNYSALCCCLR